VIAWVVKQARGRNQRAEREDHRAQLLQMCEFVQHSAHVWSGFNDEPLCVNAAGLDFLWRAILVLVRDSPPSKDDGLYRYALENLKYTAELTLRHAAAGRAARNAQCDDDQEDWKEPPSPELWSGPSGDASSCG
jgi:hypothetical protein